MEKIRYLKDFILKVITAVRDDFTMQTVAITVPSILGSIIFTSLYALAAIWSRSMWLVMMTLFYIVTILMKGSILVAAGKNFFSWSKDNSSAVSYRKFSWYLLMFDIALAIVVGVFHIIGFHKEYPGYTIYAAAIFVIGKIYFAARNMIKAQKTNSYTTIALRKVNAVKAIVSALILQNAVLSRFGPIYSNFTRNSNSVSGTIAFLIILFMSIGGLYTTRKERT